MILIQDYRLPLCERKARGKFASMVCDSVNINNRCSGVNPRPEFNITFTSCNSDSMGISQLGQPVIPLATVEQTAQS